MPLGQSRSFAQVFFAPQVRLTESQTSGEEQSLSFLGSHFEGPSGPHAESAATLRPKTRSAPTTFPCFIFSAPCLLPVGWNSRVLQTGDRSIRSVRPSDFGR